MFPDQNTFPSGRACRQAARLPKKLNISRKWTQKRQHCFRDGPTQPLKHKARIYHHDLLSEGPRSRPQGSPEPSQPATPHHAPVTPPASAHHDSRRSNIWVVLFFKTLPPHTPPTTTGFGTAAPGLLHPLPPAIENHNNSISQCARIPAPSFHP